MYKGNPPEMMREIGKLGGRPKGSRSKATLEREKANFQDALDKEEARQIYVERMSHQWDKIVDVHIEQATLPENREERKEAIHQFIGKPVEKVEVEQTTTLRVDV